MYTDEYKSINKRVLAWIKQWDRCVFGRRRQTSLNTHRSTNIEASISFYRIDFDIYIFVET
jgi:hypothetical protein